MVNRRDRWWLAVLVFVLASAALVWTWLGPQRATLAVEVVGAPDAGTLDDMGDFFRGSVEGSDPVSPFDGVRWPAKGEPQVLIGDVWYELVAVEGWPIGQLLSFVETKYGAARVAKRFEEDLAEVFSAAGRVLPAEVVLRVRLASGGGEKDVRSVATTERRHHLWARRAGAADPAATLDDAVLLREFVAAIQTKHSYSIATGSSGRIASAVEAFLAAEPSPSPPRAARELMRLLGTTIDGHAGLEGVDWEPRPPRYLPALLCPMGDEPGTAIVGVSPDRGGFLDPVRPFVVAINGTPIEEIIGGAQAYIADGSAALTRERACRLLRSAWLACSGDASTLRVLLAPHVDAAPEDRRELTLNTVIRKPTYGEWPRRESAAIAPGVGYLRLAQMDGGPTVVDLVRRRMSDFASCDTLIIDVRGNGGGNREVPLLLASMVMPEAHAPVAYNAVRALRLQESREAIEERMATRFLRRVETLTGAERRAAEALLERAAPHAAKLHLPDDLFTGWYVGVVAPRAEGRWWQPGRRVFVLMDNVCFSATDVFLMAMKEIEGVTLVGRPSAGGSGMAISHRIGNASIRLSSMISFAPDGALLDGRGVEPDISVPPSPGDYVVGGEDRALQAVLDLASTRK
ncbi:MAG: hypothetical protein HUU19_06380 [Phycisphaerales bacterium]|nr:hypothetical protein [Phycisphaerales bacterium]